MKTNQSVEASSTRFQQAEFPAFVNTISAPRAASAVCKRPRGRPPGPRGFYFKPWADGAVQGLRQAVRCLSAALAHAYAAALYRRDEPRSYSGRKFAFAGRCAAHEGFVWVLWSIAMIKGGVL